MYRLRPRVLIIEDEPTALHVFARLFEWWGFEALKADTVKAALELLGPHLDLVYLDLMLPDGNGSEVLADVRKNGYVFPVVICSALDFADLTAVVALRPDHVLSKPYAFDPLRDLAGQIVRDFRPVKER